MSWMLLVSVMISYFCPGLCGWIIQIEMGCLFDQARIFDRMVPEKKIMGFHAQSWARGYGASLIVFSRHEPKWPMDIFC